ncbi:hypothetical protein E1178_09810 [Roseibium hamelinense]|nr:hypothetical protein [Roseibium hamelinense]
MMGFDTSVGGFWRSFLVVFYLLPLFWISSLAEKKHIVEQANILPENFPETIYWSAKLTGLGLDWIALPLLLASLAGPIGVTKGFVPFIVVRNWTSLLTAIPYVVISLLYLAGIISSGAMVFASLATLLVVVWFRYVIARIALGAAAGTAVGIVLMDVLISLFVTEFAYKLWGG